VLIAAGGTAGHVMPALAVAGALRARGAEVGFIASGRGAAAGLVAAAGFPEDRVPMRGLERRLTLRNLAALGLAAAAVPRAARAIRRRRADVVVGAGGYAAGPAALAAWCLRRPVVLMEADAHLGMANRLVAPLARRVALAFPLEGRDGGRYLVTGRPVGPQVAAASRAAGRRALGVDPDATCVLIAGGSQGARTLNRAAVEAFGDGPPFELVHVAGPAQVDEVRGMLEGRDPGPRYRLVGYLDDYPGAIAAADLVVSRSGGSVFEIAAIGRASVLVPYPHATADHQTKNARWLADAGAAVLIPDAELTGARLRAVVEDLLADGGRREHMAAAARALGRPDAADRVADAVLEAAGR